MNARKTISRHIKDRIFIILSFYYSNIKKMYMLGDQMNRKFCFSEKKLFLKIDKFLKC